MTQPDDLHPFRVEHLNFKPAVTCEWDLISLQISQITALRCRVKNLEDALRTVDDHLMELGRDIASDQRLDTVEPAKARDELRVHLRAINLEFEPLLNPSTTIISDAEID